MRVGIDYWPATTHGPGVGRYARELVRALARLEREEPDLELRLFDVGRGPREVPSAALGLEGSRARRTSARWPRRLLAPLARIGVGADTLLGGVELFHHVQADPAHVARARQTIAIGELPVPDSAAGARFAQRLARMDRVFAFSADALRRLSQHHGVDARRLVQVGVGCEHFRRDAPDGARPANPPEILVLGALDAGRTPRAVLAAFELLIAGGLDARLRFLGRSGSDAQRFVAALERSPARSRVEWCRDPSETELPQAFARASALVHLALDAATAVTPLEAFACGLPVVVSPLPAFREALGEAAHFAPANDARTLAGLLARALSDSADEPRRRARLAIAARHTWEGNARATLSAWRALIAQGGWGARPGSGASPRW